MDSLGPLNAAAYDTTRRHFLKTCARGIVGTVSATSILAASCDDDSSPLLSATRFGPPSEAGWSLLARLAHVSDSHQCDEESPARLPQGYFVTGSAWRPYEAYASQLFDGIVRQINRIHASGRTIDFALHTGDATDNAQSNELEWYLGVWDGSPINPLTGPDDRAAEAKPPTLLDPHAPFTAQGLYRSGIHGARSTVPWYGVFGNHDSYSIGILPFVDTPAGRITPLPLQPRPGIALPVILDPTASFAYANVTPGDPGPMRLFNAPRYIQPNSRRAYYNKREYIRAMFGTVTGPAGHGFADPDNGPSYFSVSPVPGLRLIGLDTCDPAVILPTVIYVDGSIGARQAAWLRDELDIAQGRGELIIVASHHPSQTIREFYGTALTAGQLHDLLNAHPNVIAHLAGHTHRNRVTDRGGYLEIETCSTLDLPQEGRLIEIYRNEATGKVRMAYEMFTHLDEALPPLGDDPLHDLRQEARRIAVGDDGAGARVKSFDADEADPAGRPSDRKASRLIAAS